MAACYPESKVKLTQRLVIFRYNALQTLLTCNKVSLKCTDVCNFGGVMEFLNNLIYL